MQITWYSRDGHLEIMAKTASRMSQLHNGLQNRFVCHNDVEASRLSEAYGFESVTVLANEIPKFWPSEVPSQEELNKLFKRYSSIPLARVSWSDRFEVRKGEPWTTQNLLAHISFWENYLGQNSTQCLVIEVPSILSTCAAWIVCKALGVRLISPIDIAPLGNRMVLSSSWQGYYPAFNEGAVNGEFAQPSDEAKEYARAYVDRFLKKPELTPEVTRRTAAGAYEGISLSAVVKKLPGFLKRRRAKKAYYINSGGEYWFRRWARALPNLAAHRLLRVLESPSINDIDRPFFLMPLHEKYEWSNYTWMGIQYADLESVIRQAAASLPPGYELFVKEHRAGFGLRSIGFHRRVKKIPGVRLIHPYANGFELIHKSAGIVTLGSSMGWEAWLMDRPVVLLGEPWYWRLPGLKRARNAEELSIHLQEAIEGSQNSLDTKISIVAKLFDLSFDAVKYPHPDALTEENVSAWADAISRDIRIDEETD